LKISQKSEFFGKGKSSAISLFYQHKDSNFFQWFMNDLLAFDSFCADLFPMIILFFT
jgi:hypothetical protein